MQRLTARLLLVFALVGTFIPLAMALTTAPPHACCLRKSAHPCHGVSSDQPGVRSTACCNRDGRRAATTSHAASPRPSSACAIAHRLAGEIADACMDSPASSLQVTRTTRAPPQAS